MKLTTIKFYRIELAAVLGAILSVLFCAFIPFQKKCASIYPNTVRLHILAESDSDEHQRLKLAVRDSVLSFGKDIFTGTTTYDKAIQQISENLDNIKYVAENTLKKYGSDLTVDVSLVKDALVDTRVYDNFTMPSGRYTALTIKIGSGNGKNWWCLMYPVDVSLVKDALVDTRVYDNFTMPSGRYTALTIKIGSGNGKNWWCLMYPPLCINSSASDIDENSTTRELEELVHTTNYRMKFASVEIFQSIISIIKSPNISLIE